VKLRASKWTIVALGWAPVLVLGLGVAGNIRLGWREPALIWGPVGALVLIVYWVLAFRIALDEQALEYRTGFWPRHRIRLEEIKWVRVEAGWARYADRFRPMVRLAVQPVKGSTVHGFDINLKPFGREDIHRLLEILEQRGVTRKR
jgi:hypothetical protein